MILTDGIHMYHHTLFNLFTLLFITNICTGTNAYHWIFWSLYAEIFETLMTTSRGTEIGSRKLRQDVPAPLH